MAANGFWQGEIFTQRKIGPDYPIRLSIASVKDEFDVLTDLRNRVSTQGRVAQMLAQAKETATRVSVLFVNLDRFKTIYDSLGHHAGDPVLKGVATRLKACMRNSDIVSRLGDDELVVVLPQTDE